MFGHKSKERSFNIENLAHIKNKLFIFDKYIKISTITLSSNPQVLVEVMLYHKNN